MSILSYVLDCCGINDKKGYCILLMDSVSLLQNTLSCSQELHYTIVISDDDVLASVCVYVCVCVVCVQKIP